MARPREEKTETDVESVLQLMLKYKSITYAQRRSQALLQEAAADLKMILPISGMARQNRCFYL